MAVFGITPANSGPRPLKNRPHRRQEGTVDDEGIAMLHWGMTCPWGPYSRLAYEIDQEHEAILRGIRQHCRDRIQSGELDDAGKAELEAVLEMLPPAQNDGCPQQPSPTT